MELRCQLERHTAALYADRAPVITNRRADAVLSFYLARARKPLFHHPPPSKRENSGNFGKKYREYDKDVCGKILAKFETKRIPYLIDTQG